MFILKFACKASHQIFRLQNQKKVKYINIKNL